MTAARLDRLLPWLFVVLALPIATALALITPPFQNPDEGGHFLRAAQIAGGELVGRRLSATSSGGRVDPAAFEAASLFMPLAGHPERRVDPAATDAAAQLRWGQPPRDIGFPNTVLWSPVLYFPAAAAARLGQAIDLPVVATLRLTRLVNLALAVALAATALALWPAGRALLFAGLTMPMALALFGSASHDGLMIAGAALALALIRRPSASALLGGALILGLVAAGRPAYAPLVLLPLLGQAGVGARLAGVALGVACVAAWAPFAAAVRVEFPHDGIAVDSAAQLAGLLADPLRIPRIALDTLRARTIEYGVMVIGALGSLDVLLPKPYYAAATLIFLAALIADLTGPAAARAGARLLLLVALLAATALIFVSQYLIWTAVGATVIEGVQGRYFLPLLPAAALMVAGLASPAPRLRRAALIAVAGFPLVTAIVTPLALLARYYG